VDYFHFVKKTGCKGKIVSLKRIQNLKGLERLQIRPLCGLTSA
jgi:hypothetical protein